MAKGTCSIQIPPDPRPKYWPNPQLNTSLPAPNMPSVNKPRLPPNPVGGGGNPN